MPCLYIHACFRFPLPTCQPLIGIGHSFPSLPKNKKQKTQTLSPPLLNQAMEEDTAAAAATQNDQNTFENPPNFHPTAPPLSKNAQKKVLKQQKWEAKKAEKKALMKEQKKKEAERKRKEWEDTLASVPEEERSKLIESRKELRKERMEKRSVGKQEKIQRLERAKENAQNIVIDLDFSHLMTATEIHSLVQQVPPLSYMKIDTLL